MNIQTYIHMGHHTFHDYNSSHENLKMILYSYRMSCDLHNMWGGERWKRERHTDGGWVILAALTCGEISY